MTAPALTPVEPRATARLAEKLVEIMEAVEEIRKDKTFPGQGNWTYASAEQMFKTLRVEFIKRKVLVIPSEREVIDRQRTTHKGDETTVTTTRLTYTLLDAETGERMECDWAGRGEDAADRGWGKSTTNAKKTFLRDLLMLPWGDDIEADDSDGSGYGGGQGGTINLLSEARTLPDETLRGILEANSVPVTGSALTTFTRIPGSAVPGVRAALEAARR